MLKRPSLLLSSYNNIYALYCPASSLTNSSPPQCLRAKTTERAKGPSREYATINSEPSCSDTTDDLHWPRLHPRSSPTPYQIFHLKRNAPYSKRRFYELVKLYHPDRNGHEHLSSHVSSLPQAVRTERYRIVVAANDILSDPGKRKAYDTTGAGWDGRPEYGARWGPSHEGEWSGFDTNDSPFRNATWEDWEQWHQRRNGQRQDPVYMSNGGFLSLVMVAVLLGGFETHLRVDENHNMFKRQVEITHDNASKAMQKRMKKSRSLENKDQRLQSFLMTRDPYGFGIEDTQEQGYKKMLPEPETDMSDGTQ